MTPYELELGETADPGVPLAELQGELDLTNAQDLERRLDEVARDSRGLVLGLNGLRFVDSAALHALVRLARRLEEEDKPLGAIVHRDAVVAKTLAIAGLDRIVTVGDSLDDVMARMSP